MRLSFQSGAEWFFGSCLVVLRTITGRAPLRRVGCSGEGHGAPALGAAGLEVSSSCAAVSVGHSVPCPSRSFHTRQGDGTREGEPSGERASPKDAREPWCLGPLGTRSFVKSRGAAALGVRHCWRPGARSGPCASAERVAGGPGGPRGRRRAVGRASPPSSSASITRLAQSWGRSSERGALARRSSAQTGAASFGPAGKGLVGGGGRFRRPQPPGRREVA